MGEEEFAMTDWRQVAFDKIDEAVCEALGTNVVADRVRRAVKLELAMEAYDTDEARQLAERLEKYAADLVRARAAWMLRTLAAEVDRLRTELAAGYESSDDLPTVTGNKEARVVRIGRVVKVSESPPLVLEDDLDDRVT